MPWDLDNIFITLISHKHAFWPARRCNSFPTSYSAIMWLLSIYLSKVADKKNLKSLNVRNGIFRDSVCFWCWVCPIDSLTYSSHDPGFPAYLFPSLYTPTDKEEGKTAVFLSFIPFSRCISTTTPFPSYSFSSPSRSLCFHPLELPFLCRYITKVIYMCFLSVEPNFAASYWRG